MAGNVGAATLHNNDEKVSFNRIGDGKIRTEICVSGHCESDVFKESELSEEIDSACDFIESAYRDSDFLYGYLNNIALTRFPLGDASKTEVNLGGFLRFKASKSDIYEIQNNIKDVERTLYSFYRIVNSDSHMGLFKERLNTNEIIKNADGNELLLHKTLSKMMINRGN